MAHSAHANKCYKEMNSLVRKIEHFKQSIFACLYYQGLIISVSGSSDATVFVIMTLKDDKAIQIKQDKTE